MWQLRFLLVFPVLARAIPLDCPSGWEMSHTSCYKFVGYPLLSYADAESACASTASTLVSVNDATEHQYLIAYLLRVDVGRQAWYTSGVLYTTSVIAQPGQPNFIWEGDGTSFDETTQTFWIQDDEFAHRSDVNGRVIVYEFSTNPSPGYGLARATAKVQRPYICEIPVAEVYRIFEGRRGYDYGAQVNDLNDIQRGPNITEQPRDLIIISQSRNVHVDCAASGNPMPMYKWHRLTDTGQLEVTSQYDPRYTLTGGRLTISQPRDAKDSGYYQCQASNDHGTVLSNPIHISFGELREFSNVRREAVTVHEYKGGLIECGEPYHKPGLSFQWYKDSPENFVRPEHQQYIFMSDNGRLYFSEVTKVDERNYFCVATLGGPFDMEQIDNFEGRMQSPSRTSRPIPLVVLNSGQTAWGPQIQDDFIQILPRTPLRGQNVRLECFAYGTSPIYYSWSRDDGLMPGKVRFADHSRIIEIPDVQFEDEGMYRCTARRSQVASAEKTATLVVAAKPQFDFPLRNLHLDIGSELTWRCAAKAVPSATYSWFKNGVPIVPIPGDVEVNEFILKIKQLDPARDNGTYQCSAKNVYGTTYTSAELRVLSFPPTFAKTLRDISMRAAIGGNATMVCQPEAAPYPDFTWTHDGMDLGVQHGDTASRVRLLLNGNLFISPVQGSDAGTYTCTVTNTLGSDSTNGRLELSSGIVINRAPTSRTTKLNDTEFLQCVASYEPGTDMVYVWEFNGRRIDVDNNPFFGWGILENSGGLYIRNAQFEHDGVYTCIARTVNDETKATAKITVEGPPDGPSGVYVEGKSITSVSMRLRWTNGGDHGRPVNGYLIELDSIHNPDWRVAVDDVTETMTLVDSEEKHAYVIESLKPGNSYRFRIRAVNDYGAGEPSIPSVYYFAPVAAPTLAPEHVGGGGGKVGTVTMTWDTLNMEDHNGPGLGYNVFWRRQGGQENDWTKNVEFGYANRSVSTIGVINYYLEYEVKVQAFNAFGKGFNSSTSTIFSAEALPVAVVSHVTVDGFNETAMQIGWTVHDNLFTRESMKGVLKGYQVNCWPRGIVGAKRRVAYYPPDETSVTFIGVQNGQYYFCDVQVYNSAGLGPESDKMTYSSNDLAPIHYPTELHITSEGPGVIRATYRGVTTSITENSEEPLIGYKMRYWVSGEDIRTATDVECGRKSWCIVDGLERDTLYELRAFAFSYGGDGKMSPSIRFTFGGAIRMDPTKSELLATGFNNAPSTLLIHVCLVIYFIYFT